MERVKGADPGWIGRMLFGTFRKKMGLVPQSKKLAAHHTPTLLATTWMDAVCAAARTVPVTLKELAQLKVAMMAGCPF